MLDCLSFFFFFSKTYAQTTGTSASPRSPGAPDLSGFCVTLFPLFFKMIYVGVFVWFRRKVRFLAEFFLGFGIFLCVAFLLPPVFEGDPVYPRFSFKQRANTFFPASRVTTPPPKQEEARKSTPHPPPSHFPSLFPRTLYLDLLPRFPSTFCLIVLFLSPPGFSTKAHEQPNSPRSSRSPFLRQPCPHSEELAQLSCSVVLYRHVLTFPFLSKAPLLLNRLYRHIENPPSTSSSPAPPLCICTPSRAAEFGILIPPPPATTAPIFHGNPNGSLFFFSPLFMSKKTLGSRPPPLPEVTLQPPFSHLYIGSLSRRIFFVLFFPPPPIASSERTARFFSSPLSPVPLPPPKRTHPFRTEVCRVSLLTPPGEMLVLHRGLFSFFFYRLPLSTDLECLRLLVFFVFFVSDPSRSLVFEGPLFFPPDCLLSSINAATIRYLPSFL